MLIISIYFFRYSADLRAILNPYVEVEELDYLLSHVIETKALYEGMFPDSEQAFIFHELLEIVNHLRLFGPAKTLMCFAGERTMKKIGDGVTDGGQKYIISVNKRLIAKEQATEANMKSYTTSKENYTDNSDRYSGIVLKLTRKYDKHFLAFEAKDRLFNSLQEFLATQEISSLVVKSPFVRLYFTYEALYKSYVNDDWVVAGGFISSFSQWIHALNQLRLTEDISTESASLLVRCVLQTTPDRTKEWCTMSADEIAELAVETMEDMVDQGRVFLSDFTGGLIQQLADFGLKDGQPLAAFTHAVIKGIKLSARGPDCVENRLEVLNVSGTNAVGLGERYLITRDVNRLRDNWYVQQQINGWCGVTDYYVHYITKHTKQVKKRRYMAQLNYFFRLFIPCDKIVHGVAFANAVLRQADYSPVRGCYSIAVNRGVLEDESYYPHKQFIPLNYIDSTAFSVTAFDESDLPMMSPTATLRRAKDVIKDYPLSFSKGASTDVARLDFVQLHKERLHLDYLSIEDDVDGTKVFEKCVLKHHQR